MFRLSQILLSPKKAERHPFEIILMCFFYTSISLFLSLWIFPEHASLVMIFLTVIPCLYLVQEAFILEEKKEENNFSETWILKEHSKILVFLLVLFIGFLLPFVFWSIVLPESIVSEAFSVQASSFENIQSITGKFTSNETFSIILSNNLRVLVLSLLLAIFYGAGTIFILVWNASVIAAAIGIFVKGSLVDLPIGLLRYMFHGAPEIAAYFVGALAGGIISVAVIRRDLEGEEVWKILQDSLLMIIIAIAFLVIAALMEVYLTPVLF